MQTYKHPPIQIYEADIFKTSYGAARHRRVISVMNGRVHYCNGGDRILSCLISTFKRWVHDTGAVVQYRVNAVY